MSLFASYSDEQLIDAIGNGSDEAYGELFNRHWQHVYNMVYSRVGHHAVTEEMAQDIFLKLWEKRAELSIDNFSAYLYTCVKHRCLNYIEAQITRKKYWEHYRKFLPLQEYSTDRTIAYNDLKEALEKGLATIPEKSKIIFTLNRLEGRSVKEIAVQMNLTPKAIQYHITRSAKELKMYLKEFFLSVLLFLMLR